MGQGHAWQECVCMVHGKGGGAWQGLCMVGGCVAGGMSVGEMATEAAGTYNTGMHSCFSNYDIMTSFLLKS